MSKAFLYIDESKRLPEGKIVFGVVIASLGMAGLNKLVGEITDIIGIPVGVEMKSTNKYGVQFELLKGFEKVFAHTTLILSGSVFTEYRDSQEIYIQCVYSIIQSFLLKTGNSYKELEIYIDASSVFKELTRKECGDMSVALGIEKICLYAKNSRSNRAMQFTDLITGKMKEYYLYKEVVDLPEVFSGIKFLGNKKSPSEVTSASTLVAWTP